MHIGRPIVFSSKVVSRGLPNLEYEKELISCFSKENLATTLSIAALSHWGLNNRWQLVCTTPPQSRKKIGATTGYHRTGGATFKKTH